MPSDHDRQIEPESTGVPGRNLAPTRRHEQIALVALGAVAVAVSGTILIRRSLQAPAPYHGASDSTSPQVLFRININTATESDLQLLPDIGPALAARIVRRRESSGEFATVDDLAGVRGITSDLIERLRPLVRTDPEPITPWK